MRLASPAFGNGETIPRRYTGEGEDVSPPLAWSAAPPEARSFALICEDPDAPGGTYHHWAAYDIAPDLTALHEALPQRTAPNGIKQAINDFGRLGYGGPMPPRGHGPHHYHFRLIALSVDHLPLKPDATVRDVARAAMKHKLTEAELIGLYKR